MSDADKKKKKNSSYFNAINLHNAAVIAFPGFHKHGVMKNNR